MKVLALVFAAAVAVASTQAADPCPPEVTVRLLEPIQGVGVQCAKDTTYQPTSFAPPPPAILAKVCANAACKKTIADFQAIMSGAPPGCTVLGGKDPVRFVNEFNAACAPVCAGIEQNIDYPGYDIYNKQSSSPEGCCATCRYDPNCRAVTWTDYNGGTCWFKNGYGAKVTKQGARSSIYRYY